MTFPSGRFVWFEYVAGDQARAQAFFAELFEWKTQTMPAPGLPGGAYTMIAAGEHMIGGYLDTPPGAPAHAHWLAHLQVERAAATAAAITVAGGTILEAPVAMGDMGTYAVVADPLGAAFALWQPAKPDDGGYKDAPGTFCWIELLTEDPDRSVAFYQAIGGFTDAPMEMPGLGTYHVLTAFEQARAGVMKAPMPGVPQTWLPYVQVASTDDTVARAIRRGGTVQLPASDVPGVGRLAVLVDPLGAALGILQPAT